MPKKTFDYSNPYFADPRKRMLEACLNGDLPEVRKLLASGLHPDKDFSEETNVPLFYAIARNHLAVAKALRRAGADVNHHAAQYPMSHLYAAATAGTPEMIDWLLKEGADPEFTLNGLAVADAAAASGLGSVALKLMRVTGRKVTPAQELVFAAQDGNLPRVKKLMALGLRPDGKGQGGCNAFMWACTKGQTPVVRFMLQQGVSPYMKETKGGLSAMSFASLNGHREIMKLLWEADQNRKRIYPPPDELPDLKSSLRRAARSAGRDGVRKVKRRTRA